MAQPGTVTAAAAVVNVDLLVISQPVAGPLAFLGTTYQLYNVEADRPLKLADGTVTVVVGDAGGVAPVHTYTSYEVAVATAFQKMAAVVSVPMVVPLAGDAFTAQAGEAMEAVVNVVLLAISQPVAGPVAFLGTIYQLYKVPAVNDDAP
jgi:hypothetical protein